ncbi:MAG TPA: hypothetical protein VES67_23050 [Vicinamibacterales bacterium]|nr:hypothetical protein [Vicinamibacterales bacterium]
MADTSHAQAHAQTPPTEGDGVSYSGIFWFVVILTGTTLVCQLLMWGMFVLLDAYRHPAGDRAPLAAPMMHPRIEDGRIASDGQLPQPAMLVDEPTTLDAFRKREDEILHGYGWVDEAAGTARIPVDRAKELLLEKGFPVRSAASSGAPASEGKK